MDRSLRAEKLCGSDLDRTVSFCWRFSRSLTHALVTGQLRQIEHTAAAVVIQITAHDRDADLPWDEFVLLPDTDVVIREEGQ